MEKVIAQSFLEVLCDCPYCKEYIDITDNAREYLDEGLRAADIDVEVTCPECGEVFELTDVTY